MGVSISTRKWMPEMWIIQTAQALPTHEIEHVNVSYETSPLNVMMRIDPFLGCANRSVAKYEIFNNALNSLLHTDNSRKPRSPLGEVEIERVEIGRVEKQRIYFCGLS